MPSAVVSTLPLYNDTRTMHRRAISLPRLSGLQLQKLQNASLHCIYPNKSALDRRTLDFQDAAYIQEGKRYFT